MLTCFLCTVLLILNVPTEEEKNPDEIEGEIEVEAREVVGGASRGTVQAGLQHIPSQGKNEADHQAQENWS